MKQVAAYIMGAVQLLALQSPYTGEIDNCISFLRRRVYFHEYDTQRSEHYTCIDHRHTAKKTCSRAPMRFPKYIVSGFQIHPVAFLLEPELNTPTRRTAISRGADVYRYQCLLCLRAMTPVSTVGSCARLT